MLRFSSLYLIAFIAAVVASNIAGAQTSAKMPALSAPLPGDSKEIPKEIAISSSTPSVEALSMAATGRALNTLFKDFVPRTRGPQDVSLFRNAAPSVVLILTNDGLGSGSLLKDNTILTNQHVVGNQRQVTVVFKPADGSGKPRDDEVVKADVIKLDTLRDLALLRPASIPSRSTRPLELSSQDSIEVGTDVVAIGHPTGEAWTFTKGIVSQFRPGYEWSGGPKDYKHIATVIQTQTPINPGNSGGPLLTEDGKIVGVNSFRTKDSEGLNFAVAASEIRAFLANSNTGLTAVNACNEARVVFEGRNKTNDAFMRSISLRCDNIADIVMVAPDSKKAPIFALVDLQRKGKVEGMVFDERRSGNWNTSFWDPKFDETFPFRGIHPDSKLMPTRFVPRCPSGSTPTIKMKCIRG